MAGDLMNQFRRLQRCAFMLIDIVNEGICLQDPGEFPLVRGEMIQHGPQELDRSVGRQIEHK
jgi:hypothetical protein